MALRIIIFLVINFAGLALGALFTSAGPGSNWYSELQIAPWTPPGWVFGAAWTTIMICFSIYMAFSYKKLKSNLIAVYAASWILNFAWNPLFFGIHEVFISLITITVLALIIGYLFFSSLNIMRYKTLLVLPYFAWLIIATSLNAYIYIYN